MKMSAEEKMFIFAFLVMNHGVGDKMPKGDLLGRVERGREGRWRVAGFFGSWETPCIFKFPLSSRKGPKN